MTTVDPIKVLCIDDSPDIVGLLEITIRAEAGILSVGSLTCTDSVEAELERLNPDVVLLDLTMPGRDPLQIVRDCKKKRPNARFIIFSGHGDHETIDMAIEAGAWGFVTKDRELPAVIQAIRTVAAGKIAVPT